jgi:hypothetical protein
MSNSQSTRPFNADESPRSIARLTLAGVCRITVSLLSLIALAKLVIDLPLTGSLSRTVTGSPAVVTSTAAVALSPIAAPAASPTITLQVNGKSPQAKYVVPLTRQAQPLTLGWAVQGQNVRVEVLPAPGKVAAQGALTFQIAPRIGTATLMVKATNAAGQTVTQAIVVEVVDPATNHKSAQPPPSPELPGLARSRQSAASSQPRRDPKPAQPIDPDRLSPLEVAPQLDP